MAHYVAPNYESDAFNCPYCGAYAHQVWCRMGYLTLQELNPPVATYKGAVDEGHLSRCLHCRKSALWLEGHMVYPPESVAPLPSDDMPEEVAADFREARNVLALSPRSSAALLRLALQKLCKHLGESGENINHDIGELVKKGLSPQVQKAMDAVRIVGNNAVHPGELDMQDNQDIALRLFSLVNLIVYEMITRPREIAELYGSLPQGALAGIEKRDKASGSTT